MRCGSPGGSNGLGSEGVYIGRDVFGGSFCYDAWSLYGKEITGPNMLVIGQIGYAKSSLVKCLDEDTEIVDPRTGVPRTIAEVFNEKLTEKAKGELTREQLAGLAKELQKYNLGGLTSTSPSRLRSDPLTRIRNE